MELHVVEDGGEGSHWTHWILEMENASTVQTSSTSTTGLYLGWCLHASCFLFFFLSFPSSLSWFSLLNTCKPNLGYLLFVRVYLHLKSNWHFCASFKMSSVFRLVWARRRRRSKTGWEETRWSKTFTLKWKSGGKPLLPKQSHTSCKNIDGKVMATIQTVNIFLHLLVIFRSLSLSVWSYSR